MKSLRKVTCMLTCCCLMLYVSAVRVYAADAGTAAAGAAASIEELLAALAASVASASGVLSSYADLLILYQSFESNRQELINEILEAQKGAKLYDEDSVSASNVHTGTKAFGGIVIDDKVRSYLSDWMTYVRANVDLDAVSYGDFAVSDDSFYEYFTGINPDLPWLDAAHDYAVSKYGAEIYPYICYAVGDGRWVVFYDEETVSHFRLMISAYYPDIRKFQHHLGSGNVSLLYYVVYDSSSGGFSWCSPGPGQIIVSLSGGTVDYPFVGNPPEIYWMIPSGRERTSLEIFWNETGMPTLTKLFYQDGKVSKNAFPGEAGASLVGWQGVASSASVGAYLHTEASSLVDQVLAAIDSRISDTTITDSETGAVTYDWVLTMEQLDTISRQIAALNEGIAAGTADVADSDAYVREISNTYNTYSYSYTADYTEIIDSIRVGASDIISAILSIPASIATRVEAIFVPDTQAIADTYSLFQRKLPWIDFLISFNDTLVDALNGRDPDFEPVIYMHLENADSDIDYGGAAVALDLRWYRDYKDTVDALVGAFLWVVFLWNLYRRLPDIIAGAGMAADYGHRIDRELSRGKED